jgi:hypothetical protein
MHTENSILNDLNDYFGFRVISVDSFPVDGLRHRILSMSTPTISFCRVSERQGLWSWGRLSL